MRFWVGAVGMIHLSVLIICSLLEMGFATEREEIWESKVAVEVLRNENKELRGKLTDATNQLVEFERLKKDLRKGLIADDEENRRSADWRAFLLSALKTVAKLEEENLTLAKRLEFLQYASQEALKTAEGVDPVKRALFEVELRESEKVLVGKVERLPKPFLVQPDLTNLENVKVVATQLDLGVVALAVGSKQGAKIGMPFFVARDQKMIAVLTVVEVRDRIALALIKQMEPSRPIQEGDLAQLKKTVTN